MVHAAPNEVNKQPVESKVKNMTVVVTAVSVLVAVLNAVLADNALLGALPAWLQSVLLVFGPPVVAFLTGWKTSHTFRADQGNTFTGQAR